MADDFEVQGADQFLELSKALKHAGHGELRKELNKRIRVAAKPLIPKARAEAMTRLPQRGGLAKQIAKEPIRVQTRTGKDPGVRIVVGKKNGGARSANRGRLRHPLFGNRERWFEQTVKPGWFDDPMAAGAPEIRKGVEQAIDSIADEIVRKAG